MPKMTTKIVSFNGGELSPLMDQRAEQDKYKMGCRTMENFLPLIYGGAKRRPGTEYIGGCASNSAKSRMVAFEHSVDDTYVLEFANQTIRVYKDGAIVGKPYGTQDLSAISNLVLHYKCDDNLATTAVDNDEGTAALDGVASANTDTMDVVDEEGTAAEAFDLAANNDYITISDHASLSFGDGTDDLPFTLHAWVKYVADASDQIIFSKWSSAASIKREWSLLVDGADKVLFKIYDESIDKEQSITTNDTLSDGWHFIAATYDGRGGAEAYKGMKIYIDWVEQARVSSTVDATYVAMEDSDIDALVGGDEPGAPTNLWNGHIDNIALFSKELSDIEIAGLAGTASTTVHSISTPYLTADLFGLDLKHSADVMYISHGSYEPRKLSRRSDNSWKLEYDLTEDGPFRTQNSDTNFTLKPNGVTGSITITASGGSPFVDGTTAGHEPSGSVSTSKSITGALFKLIHGEENDSIDDTLTDNFTSDPALHTSITDELTVYKGVTWDLTTNGKWVGTIKLQREYGDNDVWETVLTVVSVDNKNVEASETEEFADAKYRVKMTASEGALESCQIQMSVRDSDHIGIVQITNVVNPQQVTATVLSTLGSTDKTPRWSEGAWSNYRGWPKTVDISSEERLVFGGSSSQPLTIWGSGISNYASFKAGTISDEAIIFTLIGTGQQNTIQWMSPRSAIMIGTIGGEHLLGASDEKEALTPTNVQARLQTTYGSSSPNALIVNNAVLFLQRGDRKIRELIYQFEEDVYVADDLTTFAEHITHSGITDMAFQRVPHPLLYCVRDDGELAVMAYERSQEVNAWARFVTDGEFESVCVIYGGKGQEDEVWVSVARVINGSTVRYVERFRDQDYDFLTDAVMLDCSTIVNGDFTAQTIGYASNTVRYGDSLYSNSIYGV